MKNIIAITSLFAAGAALVNATEWTITNSVSSTVDNAYFNGVLFNLDTELANSRLTVSPSTALDEIVFFDSFTSNIRTLQDAAGISLLLCDKDYKILSVSSNIVSATGDQTWSFSETKIATNENYFAYYINSSNADTAKQNIGNVVTDVDAESSWLVKVGGVTLIDYGNTAGTSSLTMMGNNHNASYTSKNNQNYCAKVSMTISSIPEPSAFGLLAGLGALALAGTRRRRRK